MGRRRTRKLRRRRAENENGGEERRDSYRWSPYPNVQREENLFDSYGDSWPPDTGTDVDEDLVVEQYLRERAIRRRG
jgi:hypothetical protein